MTSFKKGKNNYKSYIKFLNTNNFVFKAQKD